MRVLVIGDSCLDVYKYGECDRLCPAAPVPVFVPLNEKRNYGMAGNVYNNLESLGVACDLVTNQEQVLKTRFVDISSNHMIMRMDLGESEVKRVSNLHRRSLSTFGTIIISDYDKGFLTRDDIKFICENNSNVFIDTKKILGNWCRDARFIKINHHEYKRSIHFIEENDWVQEKLIITRGSSGAEHRNETFPVEKVEIKDLTGAGDTFLAGLVCQFVKTEDISGSIIFANECATKVVQQKGVNICGAK